MELPIRPTIDRRTVGRAAQRGASRRRVMGAVVSGLGGAGALLLAGCRAGGEAPGAQTGAKSRAPVTVRSWIGEPNNERYPATQAADAAIKLKYPHITVEHEVKPAGSQIETTVAAAAADSLPDLIIAQGTSLQTFAIRGFFKPLDPYLARDREFDLADFPKVAIEMYSWMGKQYAIPYDHAPIMLFYNKELFQQFGVSPPDSNWTMDDLLEGARKMHRPAEGIWGMAGFAPGGGFTMHGSFMLPWGGSLLNDAETETQIDSKESIEALDFWAKTRLTHRVNPMPPAAGEPDARTLFTTGKAALHDAGLWAYRDIVVRKNRAEVPFTPDVADWPKGPKGRFTSSMGSGYGITKDSKHPDDAWLYLGEYVGKDMERSLMGQFLKTGFGIPVRLSLMAKWEVSPDFAPPSAKLVAPAAKYSVIGRPISPAKAELDKIVNDAFAAVWAGTTSVSDAAREIKRLAQPVLEQNKQHAKSS